MRLFSLGLPVLGIMVVGTVVVGYAMREKFDRNKLLHEGRIRPRETLTAGRVDGIEKAALDRAVLSAIVPKKEPLTTLDEEAEMMEKKLRLEQWKQVRVPRPGEGGAVKRMKEAAASTKTASSNSA